MTLRTAALTVAALGTLLVSAAAYAADSHQSVLRVGAVVTSSCAVRAPSAATPSLHVRCVERRAAPIVATVDHRAPVMVELMKEAPWVMGATVAVPPGQESAPARRVTIQF
jgi:hypothetical protein